MFQNISSVGNFIDTIIYVLPCIIIALTLHEIGHGLMAYWLGDHTAKRDGRLSLNPLKHIDPIGFILIILVGFSWAKPVMVNPYNLKDPKKDMALISLAGPLVNFILALIGVFIIYLLAILGAVGYSHAGYSFYTANSVMGYFGNLIITFISLNITLAVFNLLPIPPLDGSKFFGYILPDRLYYRYIGMGGSYAMIAVFVVIIALNGVLSQIMNFVFNIFMGLGDKIYFLIK